MSQERFLYLSKTKTDIKIMGRVDSNFTSLLQSLNLNYWMRLDIMELILGRTFSKGLLN